MPTNTHIMTMKQLTIWVGTDSGASAGSERLLARFPQKSAVNTAGSNMTTMARMKAKMGTSLHTMTMAVTSMTPNATLPIQMDSQYPQPETRPTNGPKPSRA